MRDAWCPGRIARSGPIPPIPCPIPPIPCLDALAFHVSAIRPEREQEEKGAQHILPFRHPRYRLHMQRVPGKQRRDTNAPPHCPRHPAQYQKEQEAVGGVQEHIGQMMASGSQAIELTIQHMGEPGHRVPIAGRRASEGPLHPGPGQSRLNVRVFRDIHLVIVSQEFVSERRREDHQGDQPEGHANHPFSWQVPRLVLHTGANFARSPALFNRKPRPLLRHGAASISPDRERPRLAARRKTAACVKN